MTPPEAIDRWPRLSATPARVVAALASAEGRVVMRADIEAAVYAFKGEGDGYLAITCAVKHARKAGVQIEKIYDMGYRIVWPLPEVTK